VICIEKITLFQFKNYLAKSFHFTARIVAICGNNGIGKTNLLDAIYYLCFSKSYFGKTDALNAHHGQGEGFRIVGNFSINTPNASTENSDAEIVCILRETGKKELSVNGQVYEKFSDHIGKFPCVFVAPDDVQLITGGSEERRKFLDTLQSQVSKEYLRVLINYNKVLQQRNGYLKAQAEGKQLNQSLLEVYDQQLIMNGQYIFEQRQTLLAQLLPMVQTIYHQIAGSLEAINIVYNSSLLQQSFASLLQQSLEKDRVLQRTTQGIHKDDVEITLAGLPFKLIASQGQRKNLLFALRLAECEILKQSKNMAPLLLLDDVFEKLDASRMSNLLNHVCVQNRGTVFITDTHKERLQQALLAIKEPFQLIELG
jgi:DNA replication and repair protein RecF